MVHKRNVEIRTGEIQEFTDEIPRKKFYVTMTDKFLSGWGMAKGKINKFVVGVNTLEQAETIKRNAERRTDMKYINIISEKPYFNPKRFLTSYREFSQLGDFWKRN